MERNLLKVGAAVFALLAVVTIIFFFTRQSTLKGAAINPPWHVPEINLTNHNEQPFSLKDQRGKVVLLYFGYVNYPDECPLTMAHIKLALEILRDRAKDVQVIMVSTDPVRDTPDALKDFMEHFDPSFLGLTGTMEELQKVKFGRITAQPWSRAAKLTPRFFMWSIPAEIFVRLSCLMQNRAILLQM
jgi:protein SCO1